MGRKAATDSGAGQAALPGRHSGRVAARIFPPGFDADTSDRSHAPALIVTHKWLASLQDAFPWFSAPVVSAALNHRLEIL